MLRDLSVVSALGAIREKNKRIRALVHVLDRPQRDESVGPDAPLYGVPYVLKDCWDTEGIPTTGGSFRHRHRVPVASGPLHRALGRTGAVLLGKSNMSDLAFSLESASHLGGATANPYDVRRTAGGSTGGGAAAVATGMAAFDWGGDFGGSIRMPSACCGVVGLRLSYEAWPGAKEQFPALAPFFQPLMGYGPIARTVDDCRQIVRAMRSERGAEGSPSIKKDAVVLFGPDASTLEGWRTFVGDAGRALVELGIRVDVDRTLPPASEVNTIYNGYLAAHLDEFASTGELPTREAIPAVIFALASRGKLDRRVHPNTAALLALVQLGKLTLFRERKPMADALENLREAARAIWSTGRLIVAPTFTSPPPLHGRSVFAWTWAAFAKLGNLTDATSIAVPFGRFEAGSPGAGLPRSIQVLGPAGSEDAVLDLAERLERIAHPS